jgi:lysophospholipase
MYVSISSPRTSFTFLCAQAARKGYTNIVDVLVQAGASLSGLDGGFAASAVTAAARTADQTSVDIWSKAGIV